MRLLISSALLTVLAVPGHAAPPEVVTDTAIAGALVGQVMGDLGQPRVLLPKGAGVHHYQMRPSDAQALQSAQLLVWFGPELTPWLERASDARGEDAKDLELLHVKGVTLRSYAEDDDHEHEHEHEHEDHAEGGQENHEDHDDHDHGGADPHAWLDIANAAPWLDAIARELSELDPENAATYADNAKSAAGNYAALDAEIAQKLSPLADSSFVVFHDAYGYFSDHYGLRPAIAVSLGDATSPSAERMNEVRAKIAESGASCAFPEYGHDPRLVQTAIDGTDTAIGGELDPAGTGLAQGPSLYADTLRGLAETLGDCLNKG